jgi:protein O-GlcNAc transferase
MNFEEINQSLKLAEHYFRINHYSFAKHILEKIIEVDSDNSKANELLGYIYENLGQLDTSFKYLSTACNQRDSSPEALYYLGSMQLNKGLFNEATISLKNSILKGGEFFEALHDLATAQAQTGDLKSALINYKKCSEFGNPSYELFYNIARIYDEIKLFNEAITYYDNALKLKPDYAEGWSNKGVILHELKRYNEAISHYDIALNHMPNYAEAWSNKGNTLNALKRYDEAISHFDNALNLKPDYAEGWVNKGAVLFKLNRYDEAIIHYDKALSLKPDIDWIFGDLISTKLQVCCWFDLASSVEILSRKIMDGERVSSPFSLKALTDDALLHKKSSEIYTRFKYPFNTALGPALKYPRRQKIRIGYFSADLRNHPVAHLLAQFFEIHDRSRFETYAFSLVAANDEMRGRLIDAFDHFINVEHQSDIQIAQLSRSFGIDIAVDLTGHTNDARTSVFAFRAAPIQVNWLGYPGTLGADYFDYIIADKILIPESHQSFYTEKVAYLPDTYMVDDSKRVASSRVFTRAECGLPENNFVFCCFNNSYKFNPQVLDCWSSILKRVENSVLWISENSVIFKANITLEFKNRGIDSRRIIFAQRLESMADHLARYTLADLFLDTYPYNAHTTAVDSLKAGVPVITLMGQSFASRVAASLLNVVGLPELITSTLDEYVALATELATNHNKFIDLKIKLARNRLLTPLFDASIFTKNIEAAYIEMYERHQGGLEPSHLSIVGNINNRLN